jgi:hypothetical protein
MMILKMLLKTDFFNTNLPLLRRKYSAFEVEDLPGLWRLHWQWGGTTFVSTFYTCIDQACLLWGSITFVIFLTAQFTALDWGVQAVLWSGLTIAGTLLTLRLANYLRSIAPIAVLTDAWTGLMLAGIGLTDLGMVLHSSLILVNLCPLWLGLSAIGYLWSGWTLRSRAFALIGILHLAGIAVLPHLMDWQFLVTGVLMGASALILAVFQWDSGDVCAHLSRLGKREY